MADVICAQVLFSQRAPFYIVITWNKKLRCLHGSACEVTANQSRPGLARAVDLGRIHKFRLSASVAGRNSTQAMLLT